MDVQEIKYWLSEVEYENRPDGTGTFLEDTSMENLYLALKEFYPYSAFGIVSDVDTAIEALRKLLEDDDNVLNITGNVRADSTWEWWAIVSPWNNSDLEVARWAGQSPNSLHKALVMLILCAKCYPDVEAFSNDATPMFLDWAS